MRFKAALRLILAALSQAANQKTISGEFRFLFLALPFRSSSTACGLHTDEPNFDLGEDFLGLLGIWLVRRIKLQLRIPDLPEASFTVSTWNFCILLALNSEHAGVRSTLCDIPKSGKNLYRFLSIFK